MTARTIARIGGALLCAAVMAGPAAAQHPGHAGGGHAAGGHVGVAHVGSGHFVAPHAVYGRPTYHANVGHGSSFNHPGFAHNGFPNRNWNGNRYPFRNWNGFGVGWGLGYPLFSGAYASAYPYGVYSYPDYSGYSGLDYGPPDLSAFGSSVSDYPPAETGPAPAVADSARITVQLPADAQLSIDGQLMTQTGPIRVFNTPATLDPGRAYTYRLHAEWVENGQPVVRERVVSFQAGNQAIVNLNVP
jgi:uncharacterized protein (TIGR03000 family)